MTDTNTPKIDSGIVLRFMKEALNQCSEQGNKSYSALAIYTTNKLTEANFVSYPSLTLRDLRDFRDDDPLLNLLAECYHRLFISGYIIPETDKHTATFNYRFFIITAIGHRWLESSSDWIPEDRQGYLSTLNTLVPTLDSVLYQYVGEALSTYEQNSLFASAVMIGAASERAIYLLMKSLHRAVNDPKEKEAIRKVIEEERSLPKMFRRLQDNIDRAKKLKLMPYNVHEGADRHLLSLQDSIRVQRNDAVHPEASGQVKREAVHLSLSAFPNACKKVYDLMHWFNNNTLP